nr:excisionase family DNA-binding protein [Alcanivorax quisquiliarum]
MNVSRPHLAKLLEEGSLPYTKTDTHRRIRFHTLIHYKKTHQGK